MIGEDKIRIKLFGFDVKILDQSTKDIVKAVQQSKAQIKGPIPLPTKITKYTVIRSPHVNKTSREQFEMRTHKRLIDILYPTSLLMDSLMKIELAPGVEVDIKQ